MADLGDRQGPDRLAEACFAAASGAVALTLYPPASAVWTDRSDRYVVILPLDAGRCELALGAERPAPVRLRAGSATMAPPDVSIWMRRRDPIELLVLRLDASHVGVLAAKAAPGRAWSPRAVRDLADPAFAALGAEIRRALVADAPPESVYLELLADAVLARFARHGSAPEIQAHGAETLAPSVLARVVRHVDEHLNAPLRVEELAAAADLSRSHFSRAFQRVTGETPQRFILRRRICRARDLIAGGDKGLAEIAALVGFSSQAHMTKAFRDELGVTPSSYRAAFSQDDEGA